MTTGRQAERLRSSRSGASTRPLTGPDTTVTQLHLPPGIFVPNAYSMFEQGGLEKQWFLVFPGIGSAPFPGDGNAGSTVELDFWIPNPDPQHNDNWYPFIVFEIFFRGADSVVESLVRGGFIADSFADYPFGHGLEGVSSSVIDFQDFYSGELTLDVSTPTPVVVWAQSVSGSVNAFKLDVPGLSVTSRSDPNWWRSPLYFVNFGGLAPGFVGTPYDMNYARNYGPPQSLTNPFNEAIIELAGGSEKGYKITTPDPHSTRGPENFPPGLTLETDGSLSGTPTTPSPSISQWQFSVVGTDSDGNIADATTLGFSPFGSLYTFLGAPPVALTIDQVTDISFRSTATLVNYDTALTDELGSLTYWLDKFDYELDAAFGPTFSVGFGSPLSVPAQGLVTVSSTMMANVPNGSQFLSGNLPVVQGHEQVAWMQQGIQLQGLWGVFNNVSIWSPPSASFLFKEPPAQKPYVNEFTVQTSTPPSPISVTFTGDSDIYYVMLSLPNQSDFNFFSFLGGGGIAYNYELTAAPSGSTLTASKIFDFFGDPRGTNPNLLPLLGGADTDQPSVWGDFVFPLWAGGFKQTGPTQIDASTGQEWNLPTTFPGETWEFSYDNLTAIVPTKVFAGQPIDVVVVGINMPGFANWHDPVTWAGLGSTLDLFAESVGFTNSIADQTVFKDAVPVESVRGTTRGLALYPPGVTDFVLGSYSLDGLLVYLIQTYRQNYDFIQGGPDTVNNFGDYLWDTVPTADFSLSVTSPSASATTTTSSQAQWTLLTTPTPLVESFSVGAPIATLTCPSNGTSGPSNEAPDYISSQGEGVPNSGILRTSSIFNRASASMVFLRANPQIIPPELTPPPRDDNLPPVGRGVASTGRSAIRLVKD